MRSKHSRGNLFVANLPPEFSDDQLAEAFDSCGIVLSAAIARDPVTGKRLRYGFVDIATERAAKLAVETMNGVAIDGHNIEVRISERAPGANKPPRPTPRAQPPLQRMTVRTNGGDTATGSFKPRPQPRREATFQVERRSLPRRSPN